VSRQAANPACPLHARCWLKTDIPWSSGDVRFLAVKPTWQVYEYSRREGSVKPQLGAIAMQGLCYGAGLIDRKFLQWALFALAVLFAQRALQILRAVIHDLVPGG
jgi:fatty acid desaturase